MRPEAPSRSIATRVLHLLSRRGEPFTQAIRHEIGYMWRNAAAPLGNLFDEARRDEGVLRVGRHEQRLDAAEAVVHLRHLQLVVEVAGHAYALDDRADLVGVAEV